MPDAWVARSLDLNIYHCQVRSSGHLVGAGALYWTLNVKTGSVNSEGFSWCEAESEREISHSPSDCERLTDFNLSAPIDQFNRRPAGRQHMELILWRKWEEEERRLRSAAAHLQSPAFPVLLRCTWETGQGADCVSEPQFDVTSQSENKCKYK